MPNKPEPVFEFVDADEVSFVKRGRKPSIDQNLVNALRTLPAGKAAKLVSLKVDPQSAKFAADKSRIASQIRTACKAAGLVGFRILWTPDGVPQVVR